jgi:uncharacterized protein (TIGR02145 family)
MKKFIIAIGLAAFTVIGCDSGSSSTEPNTDDPVVESSSAKRSSSSSVKSNKSSSSSEKKESSSSSSNGKSKSSSSKTVAKSSSSQQNGSGFTVNETCTESGACDAMVKSDISTWHFVRKDDFGDNAEYTYKVDGRDLIVTIKSADGSTSSNTYTMYNMESEVGVEMAFNAAKSTCNSGDGNNNVVKTCVIDTVYLSSSSSSDGWSWDVPKEQRLNPEITYGTMTDPRDNKEYKTIKIGNQTWMAENLNYYDKENPSLKSKSWCQGKPNGDHDANGENAATCDVTGRLYSWVAAIDSAKLYTDKSLDCGMDKSCILPVTVQGICPDGWHLPDTTEWRTLFNAAGGQSAAGKHLKSQTGWISKGNGTDTFGFSALPAGRWFTDLMPTDRYKLSDVGEKAFFWTSTKAKEEEGAHYILLNSSGEIDWYIIKWDWGYPVRCLKDDSSSFIPHVEPCKTEDADNCKHGTLTDSRDGQTYKTVVIGTQTWMAENLNLETANSYCFKDVDSNCTKFGRLYTWASAMDSAGTWSTNSKNCGYRKTCSQTYPVQGVCPTGWHIPTFFEWRILFTAIGSASTASKKLKSTSGWLDNNNGTDDYAFSALTTGYKTNNGYYQFIDSDASFWSSTEDNRNDAYYMYLGFKSEAAYLPSISKETSYTVRCLKD